MRIPSLPAGPLASPYSIEAHSWLPADEGDPMWPEVQFLYVSATAAMDKGTLIPFLAGYDKKVRMRPVVPLLVES